MAHQIAQRHLTKLADGVASKTDRRGIVAQPTAVTRRAIDLAHEVFQLQTQARRDARSFFDGGVKPLVLKAECGRRKAVPLRFRLSAFGLLWRAYVEPLLSRP